MVKLDDVGVSNCLAPIHRPTGIKLLVLEHFLTLENHWNAGCRQRHDRAECGKLSRPVAVGRCRVNARDHPDIVGTVQIADDIVRFQILHPGIAGRRAVTDGILDRIGNRAHVSIGVQRIRQYRSKIVRVAGVPGTVVAPGIINVLGNADFTGVVIGVHHVVDALNEVARRGDIITIIVVRHGIRVVPAVAVHVAFAQPHSEAVLNQAVHLVAGEVGSRVTVGRNLKGRVALVKVNAAAADRIGAGKAVKIPHVKSVRPIMVVDDIQQDRNAAGMAGLHQGLESIGTSVSIIVRRELLRSVVAPVAVTGKFPNRHDLDRADAQVF